MVWSCQQLSFDVTPNEKTMLKIVYRFGNNFILAVLETLS